MKKKYFLKAKLDLRLIKDNKIVEEKSLPLDPSKSDFMKVINKWINKYWDGESNLGIFTMLIPDEGIGKWSDSKIFNEMYKGLAITGGDGILSTPVGDTFASEELFSICNGSNKYIVSCYYNHSYEMIKKKMDPIPKVGKTYNSFDDGKIRESRLEEATILEVIPFKNASERYKKLWIKCKNAHIWIMDKKTDYFIKAKIKGERGIFLYARSKGGWYTFYGNSRLDVTGKLWKDYLTEIGKLEIIYNKPIKNNSSSSSIYKDYYTVHKPIEKE